MAVSHPSPRIEIGTYDPANHFMMKGYDIFERGHIRNLISYCEYNGYYRVPTGYKAGRLRMSNECYESDD